MVPIIVPHGVETVIANLLDLLLFVLRDEDDRLLAGRRARLAVDRGDDVLARRVVNGLRDIEAQAALVAQSLPATA